MNFETNMLKLDQNGLKLPQKNIKTLRKFCRNTPTFKDGFRKIEQDNVDITDKFVGRKMSNLFTKAQNSR